MQSTEQQPEIIAKLSLAELTALLIKNQDLHEGLYNIAITFQIGVGAVGPKNEQGALPGASIGISGVGLSKTPPEKANAQTVDAAKVNPAPKRKKK